MRIAARRGTVRRFVGDRSMVVVSIQREDGCTVSLAVETTVADDLVKRFGVPRGEVLDMGALLGRRVEYDESATGIAVRLDVLTDGLAASGRAGEPVRAGAKEALSVGRKDRG